MFACPHCEKPLQPLRGRQGVVWTCPACQGRAVSFGVLRKMFGNERVAVIVRESFQDPPEHGGPCPVCQGTTARVTWMEKDCPLTVDLCRQCEFVWFNPGEYESLAPAPPPVHRLGEVDLRTLPIEVREQIAMEKVREIAREARTDQDLPELTWQTVPATLGFPVEVDADPCPRAPLATYIVTGIIAVVSLWAFLVGRATHRDVAQALGLMPAKPFRLDGLTFITSFFLHGSVMHLVGNLYFLVVFGRHVETYLGAWRWLLVVAVAALAGDVLDIACRFGSNLPLIGASGGISGLLAFYALQFPHARLGFFFWYQFYLRWINVPAWGAFAAWILLQFWGAFLELRAAGNVASLAHLGGVAAGLGFWLLWRNLDAQPAISPTHPRIQIRSWLF